MKTGGVILWVLRFCCAAVGHLDRLVHDTCTPCKVGVMCHEYQCCLWADMFPNGPCMSCGFHILLVRAHVRFSWHFALGCFVESEGLHV
jgi:hypothetical protein